MLAAIALVVTAARAGWMPAFFVQGEGGLLPRQIVLGEGLRDEAHVAMDQQRPVARRTRDGDPGALLSAMLQRKEAKEGHPGDIGTGSIGPEDATFFVQIVAIQDVVGMLTEMLIRSVC